MPKFQTDGEIEIKITPQRFFDMCSLAEQNCLCDIIMDEYALVYEDENLNAPPLPRSYREAKFYIALGTLEENWLSISKEDAETIMSIANKY